MSPTSRFNKVFGIGLSKTGTTSLADALNAMGISCIHYPHDPHTLEQLEHGDLKLKLLDEYDAITDTPVVPYFAQLDQLYPGSKFILTVREKEAWLRSAESHWRIREDWCRQNEAFRRFSYFILAAVYGTSRFNAERFSYVYDEHLKRVTDYFRDRPDDLLIMDICAGEDWAALCPFLGVDTPASPFPVSNTKAEKAVKRQWIHDLDAADADLAAHVPRGSSIVLIDEDQLAGSTLHQGWSCSPFPERNGRYWGHPVDSRHAIDEARRLVASGAKYVVLAWPAFWWLDHYDEFADFLRSHPCIVQTERVIAFDLQEANVAV